MKKILFVLASLLILGGLCSLWGNVSHSKALKELNELKVTAENASPTKVTLRFSHPNLSTLKKYRVTDDCYFILKSNGNRPIYLDSVEFKPDDSLTMDSDLTATLDKSWEHTYGPLEPGDYVLGLIIREKTLFRTNTLKSIHVNIQIP